MEIKFEKNYLKELYLAGKVSDKKYRFQPDVIKKYQKVIDLMESLSKIEDLYRFHSLNYETLKGNKKGRESVRINNKYRIEFESTVVESEITITVCKILDITNHYK